MSVFIHPHIYVWGYLGNNGGTFRDVDTVQENTAILVLGSGGLLNLGSGLGDVFEVGTTDNDFVLLIGSFDSDVTNHLDAANALFTHVVTDFDALLVINDGNVNGEMAVGRTHLELEALGDTLDHVINVSADGLDASDFLATTEPLGDADLVTSDGHFDSDVLEAAFQGTTGTSDFDDAGVDFNLDAFGNVDNISLVDSFHAV